jgi:hypothetical protein
MIDLSVVVQQAFTTFKDDAQELSNVSIKLKDHKYKLADITRQMLEHLCELDLIDIKVANMAHERRVSSSRLATAATLSLPENRVESTAYYLNQLEEEEIERMVPLLTDKARRELREKLT